MLPPITACWGKLLRQIQGDPDSPIIAWHPLVDHCTDGVTPTSFPPLTRGSTHLRRIRQCTKSAIGDSATMQGDNGAAFDEIRERGFPGEVRPAQVHAA
jgi:hypothetical protein